MIGIDWNGPLPFSEDSTVFVESPVQPLNDQDSIELCNTIDPFGSSTGISKSVVQKYFVSCLRMRTNLS